VRTVLCCIVIGQRSTVLAVLYCISLYCASLRACLSLHNSLSESYYSSEVQNMISAMKSCSQEHKKVQVSSIQYLLCYSIVVTTVCLPWAFLRLWSLEKANTGASHTYRPTATQHVPKSGT